MEERKRKRLEKGGWTIGSVQEFLDLSDVESAIIDLKIILSEHLKSRRTKQGLTQTELANLIESSQSRVAKMEAGDASVSLDLLIRSLLALGVTRKDLARMIAGSAGRSSA